MAETARQIAEARAKWPAVEVDEARFAAHVEGRGPRTGELLIAWAAAHGDRAALAHLEERVLAQVPRWLSRFDAVAEDAQQLVRERLLLPPSPQLLEYEGRGSLEAFVRVTAVRCAIDLQRRHKPAESPEGLDELVAQPDPELDFAKLRDREKLRELVREALRGLPARHQSLLRLHYLEGVTLEKLAVLQGASRASVARWLAAARDAALARVHELVRERLGLSDADRESLLRFLQSRLDVSLRGALAE